MVEEKDELINLGSTIQLSGFKEVDSGSMVVVRKLIGSQVRKFQETIKDFERLTVHMKSVHKTEKSMKYELHADLIHGGKNLNVKTIDRNLFMALSEILRKLEMLINKTAQKS